MPCLCCTLLVYCIAFASVERSRIHLDYAQDCFVLNPSCFTKQAWQMLSSSLNFKAWLYMLGTGRWYHHIRADLHVKPVSCDRTACG